MKRFVGRLFKFKASKSEDDPFRFERAPAGDGGGGGDAQEDSWTAAWDQQFRRIAPDLLKLIEDDRQDSVGLGGMIGPSRGLDSIDHPRRFGIEGRNMIKLRWDLFMIDFLDDLRKSGMINQNIVSDFNYRLTDVRWIANCLSRGLNPNLPPIGYLLNHDLRRAISNEAGSQDQRDFLKLLDQETWELLDSIHLEKQLLEFSLLNFKTSQTMMIIDFAHLVDSNRKRTDLSLDRSSSSSSSSTSWNGMSLFARLLQATLSHIFRFSGDLVDGNEIEFENRLKSLIGLKLQYQMLGLIYYRWGDLGPKDYLQTRVQGLFLHQLRLLEAALGFVLTILHSVGLRYLARLRHHDRSGGVNPIYLSKNVDRLIRLMNSMDGYQ